MVGHKGMGQNTCFLILSFLCLNLLQKRNSCVMFVSWKHKADVTLALYILLFSPPIKLVYTKVQLLVVKWHCADLCYQTRIVNKNGKECDHRQLFLFHLLLHVINNTGKVIKFRNMKTVNLKWWCAHEGNVCLQGVCFFIASNPASIFAATYAAQHFWQCVVSLPLIPRAKKETLGVAVLWRKLFVVGVLHVVWEDLHINTVEAVNEDGLRHAARIFECI